MNFSEIPKTGGCSWAQTGWVLLILSLFCLLTNGSYAGERESRRIWAGIDLFPSMLAADLDIENKRTPKGVLLLVLLYTNDKTTAMNMAQHLSEIRKIKGIPIRVEISDDITFEDYSNSPPAGVFLTQRFTPDLDPIIQYSRDHHILVFSPFEDDVKQGIPGGIMIRDRILPYVNTKALESFGLRIKQFFLRVSKQYDP